MNSERPVEVCHGKEKTADQSAVVNAGSAFGVQICQDPGGRKAASGI